MKTFKEFCESYLEENDKNIPKNVLELYEYLKSGKSKMVSPNTVDIVGGTFFHFTRAPEHKFSEIKFNKSSFFKDFGLDNDFDVGSGFLYCYSVDDLDDKKRMIKSTYGNNVLVFDGIGINAMIDMDYEYQNVISISSIKNKIFVEDFFDSKEYEDKEKLYKSLESLR
jgi:hypothetical protein